MAERPIRVIISGDSRDYKYERNMLLGAVVIFGAMFGIWWFNGGPERDRQHNIDQEKRLEESQRQTDEFYRKADEQRKIINGKR